MGSRLGGRGKDQSNKFRGAPTREREREREREGDPFGAKQFVSGYNQWLEKATTSDDVW